MERRKKVYLGIGIAMILVVLLKVFLIVELERCSLYPEWFENGIIYVGIGVYAAAIANKFAQRSKNSIIKEVVVDAGAVITFFLSIVLSALWTYAVYKNIYEYYWDAEETRALISSCTVWIHVITAFCSYIITVLCLKKTPQYINRDVDPDDAIRREVSEEAVSYCECETDSELLARLRLLNKYEKADGNAKLSLWEKENEMCSDDIRAYIVRNGSEPVGYFLVREPSEKETEICEFFAAGFADKSFQVLNIALEKYFKSLGRRSVCISGVGLLPEFTAILIEIAIKEYTGENYILLGDGKEIGAYDIRFEQ